MFFLGMFKVQEQPFSLYIKGQIRKKLYLFMLLFELLRQPENVSCLEK